jgi:short-subunit dehydrogenase
MKSFAGKNVVVTGAGGGIGRALSRAFAREGARVIAVDIDQDEALETTCTLEEEGLKCIPFNADATSSKDMERLTGEVLSRFGHVDVLMNCVGIGCGGRVEQFGVEDWEKVVNINLWGTLIPIIHFLPHMIERRQGHIATISSAIGLLPSPYTVPYTTTKFALVGLGDSMRGELAGYNIGVTTICPTAIRTKFIEHSHTVTAGAFDEKVQQLLLRVWENSFDPDKAAEIIINAVKRNKPLVIIGWGIRLVYIFKRALPRIYYLALDIWGKAAAKLAARM